MLLRLKQRRVFVHRLFEEDLPTYWVDMCSGDHAKGRELEDPFCEACDTRWRT